MSNSDTAHSTESGESTDSGQTTNSQRFVRDNVLRMHPYVPGEQVNQAIKLNTNECAWPASPRVFEALGTLASDQLRQYPSPSAQGLLEKAADIYGCKPTQILAGNGSDDCLTIIYRSICKPGCDVVCPWPSYGLYDTLAAIQDVSISHVPYIISTENGDCDWKIDPAITQADAALCLIANPNNPSGSAASPQQILQLTKDFSGIVVVDEAYVDFASNADARRGLIPYINELDNLIVIRTFSKSYSLAGARVGLLFSNETLITELNKVKDSYNVNVMSQIAAEAALSDTDYHSDLVSKTLASRKDLEARLQKYGWTWPKSEANFLLCHVGSDAERIYRELKNRGILIRWWSDSTLSNYLRITAGTPEQNAALLTALDYIIT